MAVARRAQDQMLSEKLWIWTEEFTGVSFLEMEKNMGNSSASK